MRLLADLVSEPRRSALGEIARAISEGAKDIVVRGSAGSSTVVVAGSLAAITGRGVLLVVAHLDDAEEIGEQLEGAVLADGSRVGWRVFPALELAPGQDSVSTELLAARLDVVRELDARRAAAGGGRQGNGSKPGAGRAGWGWGDSAAGEVLIAPVQALMQAVPSAERMGDLLLVLEKGDRRGPESVVRWLEKSGYSRVDAVEEPGDYAVRGGGGIIDVFPPGGGIGRTGMAVPARLDFFGDELDRICEIDPETMASDRTISRVELVCAAAESIQHAGDSGASLIGRLGAGFVAVLHEPAEIIEQARGYYERVLDARGIIGPPALMKEVRERAASTLHVGQYSTPLASADRVFELDVAPARELDRDVRRAVVSLLAAAEISPVEVVCRSNADRERFEALVIEARIEHEGESTAEGSAGERGERPRAVGPKEPAGERHRSGEAGLIVSMGYVAQGFEWGTHGRGLGSGIEASAKRAAPGAPADPGRNHAEVIPARATRESDPIRRLVVPFHEVVHRYEARRRTRGAGSGRLRSGGAGGRAMDSFLDLSVGDHVVHAEQGIARFVGLKVMSGVPGGKQKGPEPPAGVALRPGGKAWRGEKGGGDGAEHLQEFLTLEFAGGAKLHVPAANVDLVQKYVGGFRGKPPLSTLGGQKWKQQKERVSESVRDLAAELLRVRAAREHTPGVRYPADTPWQAQFEEQFPYEETEDQLAALGEIKKDMQGARPMDRLLCGDVGFGKTEVAIRAAFKACEHGKQVAVLVPTTVLAEQHERTFRGRFAAYPFRVESVSRFKSDAEASRVLEEAREGKVDVLIGTHRLLSSDVGFHDLGLVVVDEEQRFGVEHKQRLLALRLTVDVLTLSATPIPRTLHMSMIGLRDISSLATPPADRRAVVTEVYPSNEQRIARAIARELAREGQVYFVHNRVFDIRSKADDVSRLAPGAKVVIAHGQMPAGELEDVMLEFSRGRADVLVCTNIIESGVDLPNANTIIIDHADRFGLADLHQLRGRVGRGRHRGYCHLLLPPDRPVTDIARRRLKAVEEFSMLGAGFKIAMRDLEIRGAGNILGPEQSGHIASVGYDMYCRLLDEAVKSMRANGAGRPGAAAGGAAGGGTGGSEQAGGGGGATPAMTSVQIGVTGMIPKGYIPSDQRRLEAYRRIAVAETGDELTRVREDLRSAYGEPPEAVDRLIELGQVRAGARALGVRSISVRDRDVIFRCVRTEAVMARLKESAGTVTALPPDPATGSTMPEVYYRPPEEYLRPATLLAVLRKRLAGSTYADPAQKGGERQPSEPRGGGKPTGSGDQRRSTKR